MNKQAKTLGDRCVACDKFEWRPGMRAVWYTGISPTPHVRRIPDEWPAFEMPAPNAFPDLSDAATIGCMLALVTSRWGECDIGGSGHPTDLLYQRHVYPYDHGVTFEGACLAEALVAALEAAP